MTTERPINVLVVEDNPEDTQAIQTVLADDKTIPCTVTCAEALAAGLRQVKDGTFDVVLLDLKLPDSGGIETLVKMRQQAPEVAIVVLTASEEEWLSTQALQRGAQDYLVKGYIQVYPNLLQRAMRYAIDRKRSEEHLKQEQTQRTQLNRAVSGQEEQITTLKDEIDLLLKQLGKPPKYRA